MQIVGVNSLEIKNGFGKILREASVLPIYDGRQTWHAAPPGARHSSPTRLFKPAPPIMEDDYVKFEKHHESIGTIAG